VKGKVILVGAGPGDPELLTVKALRAIESADAVLYDDLVSPEILRLIPSSVQLLDVGKRSGAKKIRQEEINFLMIALAEQGLRVVRLKSGDPLIFGRAGEEIEALRKAGIECEVIPGVSAVLGAAAATQIPLTHRHISSALVLITAHLASDSEAADWSKLAGSGATLAIYMPGREHGDLATKLMNAGLATETPCAIISRATTPHQQTHVTTLAKLPEAPQLPAPTLLVVGDVVGLAEPDGLARELALPVSATREPGSPAYSQIEGSEESQA